MTPGAHRRTALAVAALAVATAVSLLAHLQRTGHGLTRRTGHGVLTLALATVAVTPVGCVLAALGTIAAGSLTAGYFRALLLRAITRDHLTGLPNRQTLPDVLEREVADAVRSGTPLAVAVIDLDGFTAVNDAEGHGAGDAVLRAAADAWMGILGSRATLARSGGDEFVAVLPGATVDAGVSVIERISRARPHPCSAGVAGWSSGESIDATLARAGAALYRAKREGRTRVVREPAASTVTDLDTATDRVFRDGGDEFVLVLPGGRRHGLAGATAGPGARTLLHRRGREGARRTPPSR